jgi:hypothetical protein
MYSHLIQHLNSEIDPYDLEENNIYFILNKKSNDLLLLHFKEFAYQHLYDELVDEQRIVNEMSEFPGMIRELLEVGPAGLFFHELQNAFPIDQIRIFSYKDTMNKYNKYKKKINLLLEKKRGHKIPSEIVNFLFKTKTKKLKK